MLSETGGKSSTTVEFFGLLGDMASGIDSDLPSETCSCSIVAKFSNLLPSLKFSSEILLLREDGFFDSFIF